LEYGVALRVRFSRNHGQIAAFLVQLEYCIAQRWYPVVRYDTAHGFAHRDILWPDGSQEKQVIPVDDFNDALTYAQHDLRMNYRYYCDRFREQLDEDNF
jgi:hypothetical protein